MILIDETFKGNFEQGTYVALGSFDGIHKGHLTLMNKVISISKEKKALSMVYTFKNHPMTVVNNTIAPKLLIDNKKKQEIIENLGIDILCLETFDKKMMLLEPEDFIKELIERFNVRGLVVGFNYRFGHKNKGDLAMLEKLKKKYNFELYVMKAYQEESDVVSSSRIRKLIKDGELEMANELLGREFVLSGKIVDGKKLGRTIGFPTANLEVNEDMIIPEKAVYYTNVEYNGKIYKGITSVGNNPTVNGQNTTIETYILDFSEDIYEKSIKLYFLEKMREQVKFNCLDELKAQLEKDKQFAVERKIQINL